MNYSELSRQYEGFLIPPFEPPSNWQDCTRTQLNWFLEHGTYAQRLIAARWLCDLPTDSDAERAKAKRQGPPPIGPIS